MKKLVKRVFTLFGVLVVILVVAVVAVVMNINSIAKSAVEKSGTKQLGLSTKLDGANVGLTSGDVSLNGLSIASPAGFKAPTMFSLGSISVDSNWKGIRSKPLNVSSITIDKPTIVIERANGKFNLQTVAEQLKKNGGGKSEPSGDSSSAESFKMIIDQLKVSGATVVIRPDFPAMKDEYTIAIPAIELTAIGNADGNRNGEEFGRVAMQLASEITAKAAESDQLPPELRVILTGNINDLAAALGGDIQKKLDGITGDLKKNLSEKFGDLNKLTEGLGDKVGDKAKGAMDEAEAKLKEGLGGLFDQDKDEKDDEKKDD